MFANLLGALSKILTPKKPVNRRWIPVGQRKISLAGSNAKTREVNEHEVVVTRVRDARIGRSKYAPHTGKKQLRKAAMRARRGN